MVNARIRGAAPPVVSAIVLAVAPVSFVFPRAAWAAVVLLVVWAGVCFRSGRLADGAILSVACTALAAYASVYGGFFMPYPVVLPVVIFAYWRNPPAAPLPWLRKGAFGWSGALASAVVAVVGGAVAWGTVALVGHEGESAVMLGTAARPWIAPGGSIADLARTALLVGLVIGAIDEALFRGALQERLTRALGPWPGVAVQALAYGAYCALGSYGLLPRLHGDLRLAAGALVGVSLGLLLGILRQLANGLFAPIVAHALANVAIVLAIHAARAP